MKLISALATAAAVLALFALPVRLEISGTILFAAALAVIMHQDYRARRMIQLPRRRHNQWRALFRAPALRVQVEAHRLAA